MIITYILAALGGTGMTWLFVAIIKQTKRLKPFLENKNRKLIIRSILVFVGAVVAVGMGILSDDLGTESVQTMLISLAMLVQNILTAHNVHKAIK